MNRAAKFAAVALLVTVPTTYLVVASRQSLEGGERKERVAAATRPLHERPDSVTRNIYDVPLPKNTRDNRYLETNSWKSSSLYVSFTTTGRGLDTFLAALGTDRGDLVEGSIPITAEQQRIFGWDFHGTRATKQRLFGLVPTPPKDGRPGHRIVVNLTDKDRPAVHLVSTIAY